MYSRLCKVGTEHKPIVLVIFHWDPTTARSRFRKAFLLGQKFHIFVLLALSVVSASAVQVAKVGPRWVAHVPRVLCGFYGSL